MADKQFAIKLGVNSSGVADGIRSAMQHVQQLIGKFNSFKSIAAGGFVAMGKLLQAQAAWANELKDSASAIETTVRNIQALKYVAAAMGTEFSKFSAALANIKKEQSEALSGKAEAIDNFKRIGISIEELKRMEPEAIFMRISKEVESGKISAVQYTQVLKIIGNEGRDLIANMKDGAASMADEFKKSSLVVQRSMIDALDNAGKAGSKFWATIKGGGRKAGAGISAGFLGLGKLAVAGVANVFAADGLRDNMLDSRAAQWDTDNGEALEIQGALESRLNLLLGLREQEDNIAAEELKKLREKNAERAREVALSKMSVEERNKALEAEKKNLQAQEAKTRNALEAERIRSKIIEIDSKIVPNRDDKPAEEKSSGGSANVERPQADALQRIGIYRGPVSMGGIGRSEAHLAEMARQSREHAKLLNSISTATAKSYDEAVKLRRDLTRE